jgi:hypothetical protein
MSVPEPVSPPSGADTPEGSRSTAASRLVSRSRAIKRERGKNRRLISVILTAGYDVQLVMYIMWLVTALFYLIAWQHEIQIENLRPSAPV